ncbi:hypothetical protein AV540_00050 [Brevibacillus parabrevis]|uniref:hypothetical protein n=1 Tax=Brevibacillus parabrevis TaxID=54914 RepID=UPI0007ABF561|nr:hypothetical protein [Brevibacillus parabrevis]KZE55780.1 hypothetical protein AV540_00050 [Brevibacillus parabrevis]
MSYQKNTWIDHIVDPSTGDVVQQGTKFTATRANHMESGIERAHQLIEDLAQTAVGSAVVSGLAFTNSGLTATWTAGTAYVNGVRFEMQAGSITLNPTLDQYIYLDSDGTVKKTTSQADAKAKCMLWYFSTDSSGVIAASDSRSVIDSNQFVKQSEVAADGANKIPRLDAQGKGAFSITGDAGTVAGKTVGNASGNVPLSNGTANTNLNADMVDGYHVGTGANQIPTRDANSKLVADQLARLKITKSGKDANGKFTQIDYKRELDNTLFMRSVLSNPDSNGNYQTNTWTYYKADGATASETKVWTITYDADGDVTSVA